MPENRVLRRFKAFLILPGILALPLIRLRRIARFMGFPSEEKAKIAQKTGKKRCAHNPIHFDYGTNFDQQSVCQF